jgi:hypothetical protein
MNPGASSLKTRGVLDRFMAVHRSYAVSANVFYSELVSYLIVVEESRTSGVGRGCLI